MVDSVVAVKSRTIRRFCWSWVRISIRVFVLKNERFPLDETPRLDLLHSSAQEGLLDETYTLVRCAVSRRLGHATPGYRLGQQLRGSYSGESQGASSGWPPAAPDSAKIGLSRQFYRQNSDKSDFACGRPSIAADSAKVGFTRHARLNH